MGDLWMLVCDFHRMHQVIHRAYPFLKTISEVHIEKSVLLTFPHIQECFWRI